MFRKNTRHYQLPLTSHVDELPEPLRERLENSWAESFYREFFSRLDETPFAVLYSDLPSRPNVPVNVLVGLEFLKAANGWTDNEMYERFCYDLQVRYALGYRSLGDGQIDLRTVYYFRERLARHMQETGENLLEQAFEQVTDEQLRAFSLKTGKQRMDSTLLASNIRQMGRVQLLVTVLQRVWRMLSEADQERYAALFAPYVQDHPGHYLYQLRQEDLAEHLRRIGGDMRRLLQELQASYGEQPTYAVMARVFAEHFRLEKEKLRVKGNSELSASSLQSPDDLEATYREKNGKASRGYVANLSETCDPENAVQLITKVQVAPNTTDDSTLLAAALPDLKERTGLSELYTDGAYGSAENDALLAEQGVTLHQTAIRGRKRQEDRLYLDDFDIQTDEQGQPLGLTCPQGQQAAVTRTRPGKSWRAAFAAEVCGRCPWRERCPLQLQQSGDYVLRFTDQDLRLAQRRRSMHRAGPAEKNLRAAVEATVRSVKHPFPAGKLPVRGLFRVACLVIGSAAVVNIRRLHRHWQVLRGGKLQQNQTKSRTERSQGRLQEALSFLVDALLRAFRLRHMAASPMLGW
uniref:Hypothetical conserved protein n=1 Tax=uncultured Chloroflexota bacterium TaxID=166587 RepID=H5SQ64_9CHLR|nr:hypothetical conserved protein [uncultured Chloroflexota bacterium]BAL58300.1 hypothetical conserved protein [uncultured Chloroflexota bacterium]